MMMSNSKSGDSMFGKSMNGGNVFGKSTNSGNNMVGKSKISGSEIDNKGRIVRSATSKGTVFSTSSRTIQQYVQHVCSYIVFVFFLLHCLDLSVASLFAFGVTSNPRIIASHDRVQWTTEKVKKILTKKNSYDTDEPCRCDFMTNKHFQVLATHFEFPEFLHMPKRTVLVGRKVSRRSKSSTKFSQKLYHSVLEKKFLQLVTVYLNALKISLAFRNIRWWLGLRRELDSSIYTICTSIVNFKFPLTDESLWIPESFATCPPANPTIVLLCTAHFFVQNTIGTSLVLGMEENNRAIVEPSNLLQHHRNYEFNIGMQKLIKVYFSRRNRPENTNGGDKNSKERDSKNKDDDSSRNKDDIPTYDENDFLPSHKNDFHSNNSHSYNENDSHSYNENDSHSYNENGSHSYNENGSHSYNENNSHSYSENDSHSYNENDSHSYNENDSHSYKENDSHSYKENSYDDNDFVNSSLRKYGNLIHKLGGYWNKVYILLRNYMKVVYTRVMRYSELLPHHEESISKSTQRSISRSISSSRTSCMKESIWGLAYGELGDGNNGSSLTNLIENLKETVIDLSEKDSSNVSKELKNQKLNQKLLFYLDVINTNKNSTDTEISKNPTTEISKNPSEKFAYFSDVSRRLNLAFFSANNDGNLLVSAIRDLRTNTLPFFQAGQIQFNITDTFRVTRLGVNMDADADAKIGMDPDAKIGMDHDEDVSHGSVVHDVVDGKLNSSGITNEDNNSNFWNLASICGLSKSVTNLQKDSLRHEPNACPHKLKEIALNETANALNRFHWQYEEFFLGKHNALIKTPMIGCVRQLLSPPANQMQCWYDNVSHSNRVQPFATVETSTSCLYCCSQAFGPRGFAECFNEVFTYEICCYPTIKSSARKIIPRMIPAYTWAGENFRFPSWLRIDFNETSEQRPHPDIHLLTIVPRKDLFGDSKFGAYNSKYYNSENSKFGAYLGEGYYSSQMTQQQWLTLTKPTTETVEDFVERNWKIVKEEYLEKVFPQTVLLAIQTKNRTTLSTTPRIQNKQNKMIKVNQMIKMNLLMKNRYDMSLESNRILLKEVRERLLPWILNEKSQKENEMQLNPILQMHAALNVCLYQKSGIITIHHQTGHQTGTTFSKDKSSTTSSASSEFSTTSSEFSTTSLDTSKLFNRLVQCHDPSNIQESIPEVMLPESVPRFIINHNSSKEVRPAEALTIYDIQQNLPLLDSLVAEQFYSGGYRTINEQSESNSSIIIPKSNISPIIKGMPLGVMSLWYQHGGACRIMGCCGTITDGDDDGIEQSYYDESLMNSNDGIDGGLDVERTVYPSHLTGLPYRNMFLPYTSYWPHDYYHDDRKHHTKKIEENLNKKKKHNRKNRLSPLNNDYVKNIDALNYYDFIGKFVKVKNNNTDNFSYFFPHIHYRPTKQEVSQFTQTPRWFQVEKLPNPPGAVPTGSPRANGLPRPPDYAYLNIAVTVNEDTVKSPGHLANDMTSLGWNMRLIRNFLAPEFFKNVKEAKKAGKSPDKTKIRVHILPHGEFRGDMVQDRCVKQDTSNPSRDPSTDNSDDSSTATTDSSTYNDSNPSKENSNSVKKCTPLTPPSERQRRCYPFKNVDKSVKVDQPHARKTCVTMQFPSKWKDKLTFKNRWKDTEGKDYFPNHVSNDVSDSNFSNDVFDSNVSNNVSNNHDSFARGYSDKHDGTKEQPSLADPRESALYIVLDVALSFFFEEDKSIIWDKNQKGNNIREGNNQKGNNIGEAWEASERYELTKEDLSNLELTWVLPHLSNEETHLSNEETHGKEGTSELDWRFDLVLSGMKDMVTGDETFSNEFKLRTIEVCGIKNDKLYYPYDYPFPKKKKIVFIRRTRWMRAIVGYSEYIEIIMKRFDDWDVEILTMGDYFDNFCAQVAGVQDASIVVVVQSTESVLAQFLSQARTVYIFLGTLKPQEYWNHAFFHRYYDTKKKDLAKLQNVNNPDSASLLALVKWEKFMELHYQKTHGPFFAKKLQEETTPIFLYPPELQEAILDPKVEEQLQQEVLRGVSYTSLYSAIETNDDSRELFESHFIDLMPHASMRQMCRHQIEENSAKLKKLLQRRKILLEKRGDLIRRKTSQGTENPVKMTSQIAEFNSQLSQLNTQISNLRVFERGKLTSKTMPTLGDSHIPSSSDDVYNPSSDGYDPSSSWAEDSITPFGKTIDQTRTRNTFTMFLGNITCYGEECLTRKSGYFVAGYLAANLLDFEKAIVLAKRYLEEGFF